MAIKRRVSIWILGLSREGKNRAFEDASKEIDERGMP